MIFMPPGSAKSTYASVLFPPWFMANHPNCSVIGASHGSELAEDFSGLILSKVKQFERALGFRTANDSKKLWRTSNGCTYRAAGAGGSITGRRADLFIIDDPIKGRQDADSATIRDTVWKWYQAEVITRLTPGARIILIQTRWHEDDLAGRLLQEMEAGGDKWTVINLPAVAEGNDALGRQPGEALWPERESVADLERKRAAVGEREWAALFQQRPAPPEGALFKTAAVHVLDAAPTCSQVVRGWDLAATAEVGTRDPDYTVGVKLGRMSDGRWCVLHVQRLRGDPSDVEAAILGTASQDGKQVKIGIPQDPGQAGKAQVGYLIKQLQGYNVIASPEGKDAKATRAGPVASQCNVGNLCLVRAPWNRAFLEELAGFPSGAKDDQVDALARAFGMLTMQPTVPRVMPFVYSQKRAFPG